jgi:methenyltetrahydrofolate cyclohydrolase
MLQELTIEEFLVELAARKPTPGGGSVAALAGALAAGLLVMAAGFSRNSDICDESRTLMDTLTRLVDEDAKAFASGDLRQAAEVPLQTARCSYRVLKLCGSLLEDCNPNLITDIGVAAKMAEAAVRGALLNVRVNLVSLQDEPYQKEVLAEAEQLSCPESLAARIVDEVAARLH